MEVFWEDGGRRSGRPLRCAKKAVNCKFLWNGWQLCIPAVYRCRRGLVVDVLRRIPAESIARFVGKYRDVQEESLTEEKREQIVFESPLETPYELRFFLNGHPFADWHSRGNCWYPEQPELQTAGAAEDSGRLPREEWLAAYHCDCRDGWQYARYFLPWEQEPEEAVRLTVQAEPAVFPLGCQEQFETENGEGAREVWFTHPLDGSRHRLHILQTQAGRMETGHSLPGEEYDYPTHYQQLEYQFDTAKEEKQFVVLPCKQSDAPRLSAAQGSRKAAAVSLIGGADGPTAVFLAGRSSRPRARLALSGLSFEPPTRVRWRIEAQVRRGETADYEIWI